ncbi:uncharacterized protein fxyd5 isoform X2 [Anguilla anguilla]|uniref:uncharacterized protein fxyd5 isoform X2 n=1 Tax=Anguilla anguilla TaxID=7936 RepID=UPI0015A940A6|nr:uncharacterized protein fxyd5 isoform X2 [Anguilla anguilla]
MAFGWVYLCLSVTLGGCLAQLSTSSDGLAGSTVSVLELSTITSQAMVPESNALTTSNGTAATQGQTTEAPFVDENSTAITERTNSSVATVINYTPPSEPSSTTGAKATAARRESDAPARSTKKKTTYKSPFPDVSFDYDYSYLRRIGLGVAFVLFVMGILVIASSRVSRIPKCRTTSGKTYEVTRV